MKKILNKLLILTTLLLLVMPVFASSKRIITPVLYHNTGGTLEYRLYEENASDSKITDGSMSDGKKTHLYTYGQTYCAPWIESGNSETCKNDYDNQWSHLVWSSQGIYYGSTESDYTLANEGMTMLTNAYNSVIDFYTTWGKEWVSYASSTNKGSIGDLYSLFVNKSISFDGGWTISLQLDPTLTETEQKSMEKAVQKTSFSMEDVKFARVSVSGPSNYSTLLKGYETTKVVVWAVNKPIMPGKKAWLTLEQLCQYATSAAEATGGDRYLPGMFSDTGAFEQFQSVSATEEAVNGIFGRITTTITNIVGFEDPENLIFESGNDSNLRNRYLGMMPQTWWDASNTMFWFFEVIAILVLFASVINSAIKQSMASISPSIRNTLKDSIANLGIAIVLLILYAPLFYIIAKINSMIVTALSSFASEMGATLFSSNFSIGSGWNIIVQFIIELLLFFINAGLVIKINLDYFIRSITIMILHAMAPVAIASISFDNRKTIFNSWLKELIGTIFMQSFNALVLAMIMIVLKGGAVHWWYYQASLFAISSLNSWFMKIFGLQNSVADISGKVYDQSRNAAREAKKNVGAIASVAMMGAGLATSGGATSATGGGNASMAGGATAPGAVANATDGNAGGGSAGGGEQGSFGTKVAQNNDDGKKAGGEKQTNETSTQTADTSGSPESAGSGSTGSGGTGTGGEEDGKQGSFGDQGPKPDDKHEVSVNDGVTKVQKDETIKSEEKKEETKTTTTQTGGQKQTNGTPTQTAGTSGSSEVAGDGSGSENAGTGGEEDGKQGSFGNQDPQPDDKHKVSVNDGIIKVQKDDTINSEGNNMSFTDKIKSGGKKAWQGVKTATAVVAAATAENDLVRQGAREYLGYDKEMDRKGKEGYFGYQPFGTRDSSINKENQQKQRAAEEAKKKQEEEQQRHDQEERNRKIDEMYDYFAEEREQAEGQNKNMK